MFGLQLLKSCRRLNPVLGQCRTFMSPNFALVDHWDRRLKTNILQRVNVEDMYVELEDKFEKFKSITAVDLDIFANAVNGTHLQEAEDLVHKFRLTGETCKIIDSTHHAVVRSLHKFGVPDDLIRILNDRINYGIFLDDYCYLLLMDDFTVKSDFKNASKIACLRMLQEEFEDPLLNYLSLYCCHNYLINPTEWEKVLEEEKKDEDEEEIWVRVKYIRNPFFDDHFDLCTAESLIGKTLFNIGQNISDPFGYSYQLLGSVLHQKYDIAKNLIGAALKNEQKVYSGCIDLAVNYLKSIQIKEGEEGNAAQESVLSVLSEIEKLKANSVALPDDLLLILNNKIKAIVSEKEPDLISKQKEVYENWIAKREEILMDELDLLKRQRRIKNVEEKKLEMAKKEELLFFFDNEDKLDIAIEKKRVRYPKKWLGKKKKPRESTEEYVPPEVHKPYEIQN